MPVEIAVQGFALEMILGVGGRSLALGISSFGVSGFGGALTMAFPNALIDELLVAFQHKAFQQHLGQQENHFL